MCTLLSTKYVPRTEKLFLYQSSNDYNKALTLAHGYKQFCSKYNLRQSET